MKDVGGKDLRITRCVEARRWKASCTRSVPISILAYRPSFDLANICNRYLTGVVENPVTPVRRRYSIKTVKGTGEKLKDIIFDDAHGGSGTCQVSALLLLDSLVALTRAEKSNYIIDSLMRTNFVLVLVESIQEITQELRETSATGIHNTLQHVLQTLFLLHLSTLLLRENAHLS